MFPPSFIVWWSRFPESDKFLLVESRAQGIQNAAQDWNSDSKLLWQGNPESIAWIHNPRLSRITFLYGAKWTNLWFKNTFPSWTLLKLRQKQNNDNCTGVNARKLLNHDEFINFITTERCFWMNSKLGQILLTVRVNYDV